MAERDGLRDDVDVARARRDVGRRLGLDAEELDVLVRAAELHDVGKVAVPDDDPAQARAARRSTSGRSCASTPIAGERILGAAASMRPVARLVRAAHER